MIIASSILLGLAIDTGQKQPPKNSSCDVKSDYLFWQLVYQSLLQLLVSIAVLASVLHRGEIAIYVHKFWFLLTVFLSIVSISLSPIMYAVSCPGGWLATALLVFFAGVMTALATVQLANGVMKAT